VHTDDFASWDKPLDWWQEALAQLLEPLAAGERARFQPTSWTGEDREPVVVDPAGGTVILEGVGASRAAFRPFFTYSIWIESDRAVRLQRGLERDGEAARALWERWMEQEDRYIEAERPEAHADAVVRGDQGLWR